MGYEITLIVGREGHDTPIYAKDDYGVHLEDSNGRLIATGEKKRWCQVLMTLELGKVGGLLSRLSDARPTDAEAPAYFFFPPGGDGDTETMKDRYGEPLRARGLHETITAMEEYCAIYPCGSVLIALEALKTVLRHRGDAHIVVLFFGH